MQVLKMAWFYICYAFYCAFYYRRNRITYSNFGEQRVEIYKGKWGNYHKVSIVEVLRTIKLK